MKRLFTIDLKDYDENWPHSTRPSARGIIVKGDKLGLIHNMKYDYYEFPGGGIEEGESFEEGLIREVKEETGLKVIPESIREFGSALRLSKSRVFENTVFEQENFYYYCEVYDEIGETQLEDYEEEEQLSLEFISIEDALEANLNRDHGEINGGVWVKRESMLLELLLFEKRKQEMIEYVKTTLKERYECPCERKAKIKYDRFDHTMRVYKWVNILYEAYDNKEDIDFEALTIATIFHDIGYCEGKSEIPHGEISAKYCRKYLEDRGYKSEKVDFICDIIARHSQKKSMNDDIPMELVLLMEADLLDDTGAQSIVMDVWMEVINVEDATFESMLKHMEKYTLNDVQNNPMRTAKAKEIWNQKKKLVEEFVDAYRSDLNT